MKMVYDVDITLKGQVEANSQEEAEAIIHGFLDKAPLIDIAGFSYPDVEFEANHNPRFD